MGTKTDPFFFNNTCIHLWLFEQVVLNSRNVIFIFVSLFCTHTQIVKQRVDKIHKTTAGTLTLIWNDKFRIYKMHLNYFYIIKQLTVYN